MESQFPGTKLNCVLFIILDAASIENQTCILGDMQLREDPYLTLVRSDFSGAFEYLTSTTSSGLTLDGITEEWAEKPDGAPLILKR